jgi:hypothetical protein
MFDRALKQYVNRVQPCPNWDENIKQGNATAEPKGRIVVSLREKGEATALFKSEQDDRLRLVNRQI